MVDWDEEVEVSSSTMAPLALQASNCSLASPTTRRILVSLNESAASGCDAVRIAPVKSPLERSAPVKFASLRYAPVKSAPLRYARVKFAPKRWAFRREASLIQTPLKS